MHAWARSRKAPISGGEPPSSERAGASARRRARLPAFLLAALGASAGAAAAGTAPFEVAGRILDSAGAPVAGVEVELRSSPGPAEARTATTGEEGEFRFNLPAPRVTHWTVRPPGWRALALGPLPAVEPMELPAVRLDATGPWRTPWTPAAVSENGPARSVSAASGRGRSEPWRGRVVDRESGQPMAGALVWLGARLSPAVVTDSQGRFSLAPPPGAPPHLRVAAAGHLPTVVEVPLEAAELRIALGRAAEVAGSVIEASGRPLPGVEVHAAPADLADPDPAIAFWSRTGADGTFRVSGLEPGETYWLRTASAGFVPSLLSVSATRPGGSPPLRLVLDRGRAGAGFVTDGVGEPIAGARIAVLPSAHAVSPEALFTSAERLLTTETGADGRFRLPLLPPGRIDLQITAAGYAPRMLRGLAVPPVPAGEGGAGPVDLGTIAIEPGAVVEGWVVDPEGAPLAGAEVEVARAGRAALWQAQEREPTVATTSEDGAFAFRDLAPGETVRVRARHRGYLGRAEEVIPDPRPTRLTLELRPAAGVAGRVVDEDRRPLNGALVMVGHGKGDRSERNRPVGGGARTDAEGRFELDAVDAGRLRLFAIAPGHLPVERWIEVPTGDRVEDLELVLSRGATVEGDVRDLEGQPVEGATIALASHGASHGITAIEAPTAVSGEEGGYLLSGVAPGRHVVIVHHADFLPTRREIEVRPGENSFDVRLRRGAEVAGRVEDGDGVPVGSATVSLAIEAGGPAPAPVRSRTDGSFRFRAVAPGRYRLVGQSPGGVAARLPEVVEVGAGPVTGLQLVLGSGGTVRGLVLGLGPDRLQGVEIWASRPGFPGRPGVMEPDGGYRVEGLAPGEWAVTARSPSLGREARGRTEIEAHGTDSFLDLEFLAGFTLSGIVTREGRPLGGVLVLGRSAGGAAGGGVTDGGGRFRIEGLAAGSYTLTVLDRSSGTQEVLPVPLDGDLDLEIELRRPAAADGADQPRRTGGSP